MHPTSLVLSAALPASVLFLLSCRAWLGVRQWRRARRLEAEREDAGRELEIRLDHHLEQARFSYRPATRELMLDARAARLHGLAGDVGQVTVDGWQRLPATRLAAGWIDRALADGLAKAQPVHCEYLARMPGEMGRHMVLKAVPLPGAGLLMGAVAQRPRSGLYKEPPRARWSSPRVEDSVLAEADRSWLPTTRPGGLC